MTPERLVAFSDGVVAIIITIMVLEIKVPASEDADTFASLKPLIPTFLAYLLSFIHVGLYWNNHHHIYKLVKHVNGKALWANLFFLFSLSLIPFTTDWLGEHYKSEAPVILYGINLLLCGAAYQLMASILKKIKGNESLAGSLGKDIKGNASVILYILGIAGSVFYPYIGIMVYIIVACIWLVPDKRLEVNIIEVDE
ncbi:MAG: TMEM175 family protein [Arachidicoccus sp.]|nr:TMEM175 family protein [Arachidicoccus sp.]